MEIGSPTSPTKSVESKEANNDGKSVVDPLSGSTEAQKAPPLDLSTLPKSKVRQSFESLQAWQSQHQARTSLNLQVSPKAAIVPSANDEIAVEEENKIKPSNTTNLNPPPGKIAESGTTAPPAFEVKGALFKPEFELGPLDENSIDEKFIVRRISPLRSFNRFLDALFGAPVFLLNGTVKRLPQAANYVRDLDMVNTMRPNLLTVINGQAEFWAPTTVMKFDLSGKTHFVGESVHEKFQPDLLRINLFCGLKVWIQKSDLPNYSEKTFLFLQNCRDIGFDALGVISNIPHEIMKRHLKPASCRSEPELFQAAITMAKNLKVEFDPRFYAFPAHWVRNLDVPTEVRQFLLKMRGKSDPIPSVRGISDTQFYEHALEQISKRNTEDGARAAHCLKMLKNLPSGIKERVLEQTKEFVNGAFDCPDLVPVCSPASLQEVRVEKADLDFSFEGQDYTLPVHVLKHYEPVPEGYRPYFVHGSARINSALDLVSQKLADDLEIKMVTFQVQLPSSCNSVISRSANPGCGFSRRGYTWQEKFELLIDYVGPWFFGDPDLVESINNQLLAEMIQAKSSLALCWAPRLQLFDTNVDFLPPYLDSFDIGDDGEIQPSPFASLVDVPVSGFSRLIEQELLAFIWSHKDRIRFPNVRNYIWGLEGPRLVLYDQDMKGSCEYFYTKGDRLDQPPDKVAIKWVANIHSKTTLDGHLPILSDDITVEEQGQKPQIPLSSSGPPSKKSQKAKVEEVKVKPSPHWPGNWLSTRVFALPVSIRMYAASRALDRFKKKDSKYHEGISEMWAKTLLQFLPQPQLDAAVGHQKNYYLPPTGVRLPKFFLENYENSTEEEIFSEILDVEIPAKGSRLHRFGREKKPSPFHY